LPDSYIGVNQLVIKFLLLGPNVRRKKKLSFKTFYYHN
jgi:hypothetical protein